MTTRTTAGNNTLFRVELWNRSGEQEWDEDYTFDLSECDFDYEEWDNASDQKLNDIEHKILNCGFTHFDGEFDDQVDAWWWGDRIIRIESITPVEVYLKNKIEGYQEQLNGLLNGHQKSHRDGSSVVKESRQEVN